MIYTVSTNRQRENLKMNKTLKLSLIALFVGLPLLYFFRWAVLFYVLCGIYDVSRNKGLNSFVLRRYFLGNGMLTWLLSPFNVLMDLLALPYVNKGVYQLEDLPRPYQDEITRLIDASQNEDWVGKLEAATRDLPRAMIFFKWYGTNVENTVNSPIFHQSYQYIQTIGVSVFNKKESTSKHFGPFRATLRVLCNINTMDDYSAYIEVGTVKNYWKDHKLFIFDDTLLHQSFNESDKPRYCLFVDIVRPSVSPGVFRGVVHFVRFFLQGVNSIFYKNWKILKV
jgi:beta-hydroxylase